MNASTTRPLNIQSLIKMFDEIETNWMQTSDTFALGNDSYTIVDVYLTTVLARLTFD